MKIFAHKKWRENKKCFVLNKVSPQNRDIFETIRQSQTGHY